MILLMGPPGAGKGTQADRLVNKFGFLKISTGDLLRREIERGSELGKEAKVLMDKGMLVPDGLLIGLLKSTLLGNGAKPILLDGFPRNLAQAKLLGEMSRESSDLPSVALAIYIEISYETLAGRILGRLVCNGCGKVYRSSSVINIVAGARCSDCNGELKQRSDDTEETLRKRLDVFGNATKPVIEYYEEIGLLKRVDGSMTEEDVFLKIADLVLRTGLV